MFVFIFYIKLSENNNHAFVFLIQITTPALGSGINTADTAGLVANADGEAGDFAPDGEGPSKPMERSGITGASFNTANSILGSGIIGELTEFDEGEGGILDVIYSGFRLACHSLLFC